MWFQSGRDKSEATAVAEFPPKEDRRHPRYKLRNLAYVNLDSNQRGILRDIGQSGIAVQTIPPLKAEQRLRLRVDLPNPRTRVESSGRVVWTDEMGQAGIELVDVHARDERALKDWLFTRVLADADQVVGEESGDLLFSNTARPVIRLGPSGVRLVRRVPVSVRNLELGWFSVPAAKFSRFVDALVLLCATLLFHVVALLMTDTLPSWWIASALLVVVTGILTLGYWVLFALCIGVTPGCRLAELAGRGRPVAEEEVAARFR